MGARAGLALGHEEAGGGFVFDHFEGVETWLRRQELRTSCLLALLGGIAMRCGGIRVVPDVDDDVGRNRERNV